MPSTLCKTGTSHAGATSAGLVPCGKVTLNGLEVEQDIRKVITAYIRRTAAGRATTITLTLPMPVRRVYGNPAGVVAGRLPFSANPLVWPLSRPIITAKNCIICGYRRVSSGSLVRAFAHKMLIQAEGGKAPQMRSIRRCGTTITRQIIAQPQTLTVIPWFASGQPWRRGNADLLTSGNTVPDGGCALSGLQICNIGILR